MRVAPVPEKPWEIQGEQLTILKNAICKGASDTELQYCLTVAKRYKLDPFKRQIWFVPRWDASADNGKGGKGTNVYTPQVGIDGLLFMSARDHGHDFGSVSIPDYGPMHKTDGSPSIQAPEWAKVKVFKKGVPDPTEAIAYWQEYAPSDLSKAPFWRKMPRRMIGKCATALALRQAYPDLGGLYIPEECERMGEEHTESCRQIVSGVPTGGSHEAAQAVAERIITEARTKPTQAPIVQEKPKEREWQGNVELDWSENEASPILRGDIGNLLEALKPHCTLTWEKDSWWHCVPKDAEVIRQACDQLSFRLKEIMPKQVSRKPSPEAQHGTGALQGKVPADTQTESAPTTSRKEDTAARATTTPKSTQSAEPQLVSGIIERVNTGMAGKNPVKHVTVLLSDRTKPTYSCFDKKWFEALDAGLGNVARLITKQNGKYVNIIGALNIGAKEWQEDGTPVIQAAREAGGKTLF